MEILGNLWIEQHPLQMDGLCVVGVALLLIPLILIGRRNGRALRLALGQFAQERGLQYSTKSPFCPNTNPLSVRQNLLRPLLDQICDTPVGRDFILGKIDGRKVMLFTSQAYTVWDTHGGDTHPIPIALCIWKLENPLPKLVLQLAAWVRDPINDWLHHKKPIKTGDETFDQAFVIFPATAEAGLNLLTDDLRLFLLKAEVEGFETDGNRAIIICRCWRGKYQSMTPETAEWLLNASAGLDEILRRVGSSGGIGYAEKAEGI
jgi:hypothetical protein